MSHHVYHRTKSKKDITCHRQIGVSSLLCEIQCYNLLQNDPESDIATVDKSLSESAEHISGWRKACNLTMRIKGPGKRHKSRNAAGSGPESYKKFSLLAQLGSDFMLWSSFHHQLWKELGT